MVDEANGHNFQPGEGPDTKAQSEPIAASPDPPALPIIKVISPEGDRERRVPLFVMANVTSYGLSADKKFVDIIFDGAPGPIVMRMDSRFCHPLTESLKVIRGFVHKNGGDAGIPKVQTSQPKTPKLLMPGDPNF